MTAAHTLPIDEHHFHLKEAKKPQRLVLERVLTAHGVDPYSLVSWSTLDVAITNDRGEQKYFQRAVEAPASWSDMAVRVVASKYFYGDVAQGNRETSVKQLIGRVVGTLTHWGLSDGYFSSQEQSEIFRDELTARLLLQHGSFNSPVWFNVGVAEQPQCSACFIVPVEDTIESLLELQATEARLFKFGSGTDTNLSTIRSSRERLTGGGVPSGPVSFMRGFDAWAGTIKSGGKTRRAAKMQILNTSHPDIREFITCKTSEEKKAWALIDAGYDGSFAAKGGAYESVSMQNANLSVRADNEFMRAAAEHRTYTTRKVKDGSPCEEINAYEVLLSIVEGTHLCGDPGMQFDTTINRWHTCPTSGRINASNPCSEFMFLDNTSCNLASLNLRSFLDGEGVFSTDDFAAAVELFLLAQEIIVDRSLYLTPGITKNTREFRPLGLGYTNLGSLLMTNGVAYDSDEGCALAASITSLMTAVAYRTSAELAELRGPFKGYAKNKRPMRLVLERHRSANDELVANGAAAPIREAARHAWSEAIALGDAFGYRNSQTTVLAPTGTISFMMDADTTGIEPELALKKYKALADGGMLVLVNQSVGTALKKLGYAKEEIGAITDFIEKEGRIEGAPGLRDEHLVVFACALKAPGGNRVISADAHLKMMAATQPFLFGAISKTVNLPSSVTVEEIAQIYLRAWQMGIKAGALYRDSSKRTQPLNVSREKESTAPTPQPYRRRLPDERVSRTHKFRVGNLEGYVTVGLYDDGMPGEIFVVVSKEGSTLSGIMDAFATSVSMALQYGVPLATLVRKFTNVRFEPAGFTNCKEVPTATSLIDYIFR